MKSYDIVIFGNYTKDTIVSAAGIRYVDGGGFNYGAHAAAKLGLKVAAVTRLAKEDTHVIEVLRKIGVDVFPTFTSSSTHMRLEYPTSDPDNRILTCPVTAGSFTIDQFSNLEAEAFLINTSTRGEVSLEVIKMLRVKANLLVADVQGFVRIISSDNTLVNAEWPEKEQILSMIDVLKADAVEAESLTGESNITSAARLLSKMGPKEVVITHRDGILLYARGKYHQAKFYPKKLIGRSGRGDTCISSYIAKRLTGPPEEALLWSAAVTSLKMESEGPFVQEIEDVEALIAEKYLY